MEEIKVGEYVRTKDGIIDKVIVDYKGKCNNPNCKDKHISCAHNYYNEKDIVKCSKQPIGLIGVGDWVNGYKVVEVTEHTFTTIEQGGYRVHHKECVTIYAIVTKEQYENIKYEVIK